MLLRAFTYLYDLDIIDDEVFLKWKEDINEAYPGKGKALFEVRFLQTNIMILYYQVL